MSYNDRLGKDVLDAERGPRPMSWSSSKGT
jgi:hypothetical protein